MPETSHRDVICVRFLVLTLHKGMTDTLHELAELVDEYRALQREICDLLACLYNLEHEGSTLSFSRGEANELLFMLTRKEG